MSSCSPPVFYYHSVAPFRVQEWSLQRLTVSLSTLEDQLRYLDKHGFHTIFLEEYSAIRNGIQPGSGDEICLTFDDGYLDNWVYAWPLAKKYGQCFTLFVSPECVDPRPVVRPTLQDVWEGRVPQEALETRGYLSWAELKRMQESGVVDVQSHTMSHTKYVVSTRLVEFYYGGYRGIYPIWNQNPGLKPHYMADPEFATRIPLGFPLFEERSAVIARKVDINPQLMADLEELQSHFALNTIEARPAYEARARDLLEGYQAKSQLVVGVESPQDQRLRLEYEVVESKKQIEIQLQKPVHFLCWPHGDNSGEAHQLAREAGYLATTSGKMTGEANKPDRIPRIGGDFENSLWVSRQKFHFKINSHYRRQPYRTVRKVYDLKNRILKNA